MYPSRPSKGSIVDQYRIAWEDRHVRYGEFAWTRSTPAKHRLLLATGAKHDQAIVAAERCNATIGEEAHVDRL